MMVPFALPRFQAIDSSGSPLVGGLLLTCVSGTTTPAFTYQDVGGAVLNSNPIILNARGEAIIYLDPAQVYTFVLQDQHGVLVWSQDGIAGVTSSVDFGAFKADLADTSGAGLVGFQQLGAGAVAREMLAKAREVVNVLDFGAKCDGICDDTTAVANALNYAKANRKRLRFPAGTCRVTAPFINSVAQDDVYLEGEIDARQGTPRASRIVLDSTECDSGFYIGTARHHIEVTNLVFGVAQAVPDRAFFSFGAGVLIIQTFSNVTFENVERPIVWRQASQFQNSSFRNITFNNSGTFHSESAGELVGTFLTLDNINHEGAPGSITENILCNLSGIRMIQATSFLLEGAFVVAGWTVLKLKTPDVNWVRGYTARFDGFWIEFSGAQRPAVSVLIDGGFVRISGSNSFAGATEKCVLINKAALDLSESSFSANGTDFAADFFDLQDGSCTVIVERSNFRRVNFASRSIIYRDISAANSGGVGAEEGGAARVSNTGAERLFRWGGGYLTPTTQIQLFGGTTYTPTADATYGRSLDLTPNGNALSAHINVPSRGSLAQYDQIGLVMKIQLPVFTTGNIAISVAVDNTLNSVVNYDAATYSGQVVDLITARKLLTAPVSKIAISIDANSVSGLSGNLRIYMLEVTAGNTVPCMVYPDYPTNIVTWNSIKPTTGAWVHGDIVWNSAPVPSGIPGWVCTASGTPGTWNAMGVLAT